MIVSKYKTLLKEYDDVFEAPGKSLAREMDYRIVLIDPKAPTPFPWLYRMLEDELIVAKLTIRDYNEKGWIRPSSRAYGAPVLLICNKMKKLDIIIDYYLFSK